MSDLFSVQVTIHGRVQGVFFRSFTSRQASKLGITGYVRNMHDGRTLEVQAEGEKTKLKELIEHLKIGPPGAKVEIIDINWSDYTGSYPCFSIRY